MLRRGVIMILGKCVFNNCRLRRCRRFRASLAFDVFGAYGNVGFNIIIIIGY